MYKSVFPLALSAALVVVSGCSQQGEAGTAEKGAEAVKEAGDKSIAAGLDQKSRFVAIAKAAGIDATLAGPGPYTVFVPTDAAFDKLPAGTYDAWLKPESRPELSQVLTYHIMPGTVLVADLNKAIDQSNDKKAVLATMGGATLTATREGDRIVLTDSAGNKGTLAQAEETRSNGVVHGIDAVMMPSRPS